MESAYTEEEKVRVRKKTAKALLWVGIASIVMLFAGFTSAYIVRQSEGNWLQFELPNAFYVSTAIILLSSFTMFWASFAAKRNDQKGLFTGLVITFVLGIGFMYSQVEGFFALREMGVYFLGSKSNASGSFTNVLVLVHVAHVIGGMVALAVTAFNARKGLYSSDDKLGVELCATYWHFIDLLWVYLFLFLLYIR